MLKTMAWISLGAALGLVPVSAVAQTGYGVNPSAPSTTPFDRAWNHANQSKEQARASAAYVAGHNEAGSDHHHHHYHHHYHYVQ